MADKEVYLFEDGRYPDTKSLDGYGPSSGWQLFSSNMTTSDFVDYYSAQGASHNNIISIGYWNSTADAAANQSLWNTIDWSKQYNSSDGKIYGRNTAPGDGYGSFKNKDGYFRMSNGTGITAREESKGFKMTCYDNTHHYITINFCKHKGRFGGNGSGNDTPAGLSNTFTGSYLPHVIGFAFRWSSAGSHSSKECSFPRRVFMHYARDTGGTPNPSDPTGREIISIEMAGKMNHTGDLNSNVTEAPGVASGTYRYKLSDDQFATYRSSFDRSTNEIKDKYRFIGFSIEFKATANGTALKTMSATIWDFMPIVSSNNILSKSSQYSPKEYVVVPDADNFAWSHAQSTGTSYNNPGPRITK